MENLGKENAVMDVLKESPLFQGMSSSQIRRVINALSPVKKTYQKGETLLLAGEHMRSLGVILSGKLAAHREDRFGGSGMISILSEGDLFGEILASSESLPSPVTVNAEEITTVLLFDYYRMLDSTTPGEDWKNPIRRNLLREIAVKYFSLMKRVEYLGIKSLRKRISAYLLDFERETFYLPFNRSGMAEFLCVDRSALSRELGRMQEEGLITFHKNCFTIHKKKEMERGVT